MSEQMSGWTRHGHRIKGTVQIGKPKSVARCGGPGLCAKCSIDAAGTTSAPTPDANDPSAQEELAGVVHRAFHDHWNPGKPLDLYADSALWQALADAILRAGFGPVRAIQAERDAEDVRLHVEWHKAETRAESATAAHAALVAGIEGLADEFLSTLPPRESGHATVRAIRALLPTPTTDTKEQR